MFEGKFEGQLLMKNTTLHIEPLGNLFYGDVPAGSFAWWECYGLCPRHKLTELANSFCSVLVSVSAFLALSTIFRSIYSPDNSPLSHSFLPVLQWCMFEITVLQKIFVVGVK